MIKILLISFFNFELLSILRQFHLLTQHPDFILQISFLCKTKPFFGHFGRNYGGGVITTPSDTDLLPAVHILGRRLNVLNFIDGVVRVDVLPVLTVGAVAAALPVASTPGG